MKKFFFIFIFFQCTVAFAQNKKIDSLVNAIAELQCKEGSFYHSGMFCSQRGKHKLKEDNTIFYTSLIAFTIQNVRADLSRKNQLLADSICKKAIPNYNSYQNKTGIKTYNFWQTAPPQFFPNSRFLSKHKFFNIPDDADCTVFVYLTDSTHRSDVLWLKNKLVSHANLSTLKIKNTYKKYRNLNAYSTWFGKNMPVEFDICVQSNILYWVYKNKLPLNKNDTATISLIHSMILSGEYLKRSYYVSPSYKKPAIVLYHLSRLLANCHIAELEDCRQKIKEDIKLTLKTSDDFMEKIILSTALMNMGEKPESLNYPKSLDKEINEFAFFNADLFSPYARPSLKFISKSNMFIYPYHCKAYCLTLLLEYEELKNKF